MNKFVQFCFITVAMVVVSGCVNSGGNMHPNAVAGVRSAANVPITTDTWQGFLATHDRYNAPNDTYLKEPYNHGNAADLPTIQATKDFQGDPEDSTAYLPQLPQTGYLNWATYFKAMRQSSTLRAAHRSPQKRKASGGREGTLTADAFHYPMKFGCTDKSGDPQVTDWQNFLVCMGYMSATTGTFNSTTQLATKQFQVDNGLTANGTVDLPTYQKAVTYHSSCPMNTTPVSGSCNS